MATLYSTRVLHKKTVKVGPREWATGDITGTLKGDGAALMTRDQRRARLRELRKQRVCELKAGKHEIASPHD